MPERKTVVVACALGATERAISALRDLEGYLGELNLPRNQQTVEWTGVWLGQLSSTLKQQLQEDAHAVTDGR